MSSVKTIYKDGVFRPVDGQDLSSLAAMEGREVEVTLPPFEEIVLPQRRLSPEERRQMLIGLAAVAADLEPDLAARHNEHR